MFTVVVFQDVDISIDTLLCVNGVSHMLEEDSNIEAHAETPGCPNTISRVFDVANADLSLLSSKSLEGGAHLELQFRFQRLDDAVKGVPHRWFGTRQLPICIEPTTR